MGAGWASRRLSPSELSPSPLPENKAAGLNRDGAFQAPCLSPFNGLALGKRRHLLLYSTRQVNPSGTAGCETRWGNPLQ